MPYQHIAKFRLAPATHVVSLGPLCSVAANLRRYYNFRSSYPFDWWITPVASRTAAWLRRGLDIDYLYRPHQLQKVEKRGHVNVSHKSLRFGLAHEFPRIPTAFSLQTYGAEWTDHLSTLPIRPDFHQCLEIPRARTGYLVRKLLNLNRQGERLLFVRAGQQHGRMFQALDTLFPDADWTLARVKTVAPDNATSYMGDPAKWDAQFSALGVTLDRQHHQDYLNTMPNPDVTVTE